MLRSSETIGAVAAALAKAQSLLTNPEKSLTATVQPLSSGEGAVTFRYASLSCGLEIIRAALGQHELAIVQTTSIDERQIRLTTVLAHASGEWIASDWPVCAVTDIGTPRRMGAALTYARRYALFALVGIAGEDDLDAPDLERAPTADPVSLPRGAKSIPTPRKQIDDRASAATRDRLLDELLLVGDDIALALWAKTNLSSRNQLTSADVETVDRAFVETRARFDVGEAALNQSDTTPSGGIAPSLCRTVRRRHKRHLVFVASQPCLVCKRAPSDPHHLKFAQPRALGRKVSDEFTVPLCREHHQQLHHHGNELSWWASIGLAPLEVAADLWASTLRGAQQDEPRRGQLNHSESRP